VSQEIADWIAYIKAHPDTWKQEHTDFINAQFDKAYAFIEKIGAEPDGVDRLCTMYGITNKNLIEELRAKFANTSSHESMAPPHAPVTHYPDSC